MIIKVHVIPYITGTAIILIVAYTIRRMPYMIRSTMGTMMAIRRDIEEAAENLGASKLFTLITSRPIINAWNCGWCYSGICYCDQGNEYYHITGYFSMGTDEPGCISTYYER